MITHGNKYGALRAMPNRPPLWLVGGLVLIMPIQTIKQGGSGLLFSPFMFKCGLDKHFSGMLELEDALLAGVGFNGQDGCFPGIYLMDDIQVWICPSVAVQPAYM